MSDAIGSAAVLKILKKPLERSWTVQGFGMLRTYLDDAEVHRLHLWDPAAAFAEVSTIHDHPWDFTSRILSGRIRNQRYSTPSLGSGQLFVQDYRHARIKTGEGGGIVGASDTVKLRTEHPAYFSAGEEYSQLAPELHESFPSPGAVTVISRTFSQPRGDQVANVYWPLGSEWVTAEPRSATDIEVLRFASLALERWQP